LLGQAGKGIGVFGFLGSDLCCCKLSLDEEEPNARFLLIIGTKLNLRSSQDMFANSEKAGKVQRLDGHSSQEE
jgi:hypothetical protein